MGKYIFNRILSLIPVILGVTFVVFAIVYFSPSEPARNILGEFATEEDVEKFNEEYGLNEPFLKQYTNFIIGIFTFDVGKSYVTGKDASEEIMTRFPATVILAVCSMVLAILIAVPAGIISATRQNSLFDRSVMFSALLGISIPNFWLGIMLIIVFSVNLGLLPSLYTKGDITSFIMPSVVLGTAMAAEIARMTRSSMLEVIRQDYIVTARAKGLPENQIIWKHALKNAMIPVITILGLLFAGMLGGSASTEKVFAWPGLGTRIIEAQSSYDIPVIIAGVVYIAIIISVLNLIVDILYVVIDPQIRANYTKK